MSFILFLVSAEPVNLHDWTCDNWNVVGTVNQPLQKVTCTVTGYGRTDAPRFNPQLPVGLTYNIISSGTTRTVEITGTPSIPQQTKTYSVGFKEWVSQLRIGIIGAPTTLSYGFDSMTQYVGVPIEPVPARSDAYLNSFTISPSLPEGVNFSATDGTITGVFPSTASNNQVYTVVGSNQMGSVQTTIKFVVREEREMTENGYIGCYWSGTTECRTPAFDYYYQNTAQFCQREQKLDYTDSYSEGSGNTWPGLDERFRDYYTSYMYGYIHAMVEADYTFQMASDDASFLYIDSLENEVINRDGCRGSSVDTATKHLSAGKHLFVVKFLEINGAATLSLYYAAPDVGLERTVLDSTQTKIGGRGPTFITYPLITGYANAELKVYTPEMVSGGADSWTVTPALPAGMTLDQHRGQIRGKPSAVYTGYHTITATGVNGVASTQIQIIISDAPMSGFRGQYYKVLDAELCMYTNLAPSQIDLKVVKLDAQLNWEQTSSGVWSGLPTDFNTYFYAEWEGYLHFTEIGNWKLRLKCDDSCRLFGIEETLLIDHWSCHTWSEKEATIAVSSTGYYYYKIRYQQKDSSKGLILEWQPPTGNYVVVPADQIFHLAPGMLSYDYEQAHYFQGVEIVGNNPHLFSVASCNNYQASPALPNGLSLNPASGVISGTPAAVQGLTQYTISCTAPNGRIETTVRFDVYFELAPSGLYLVQDGAAVGTNVITGYPGQSLSAISVSGTASGVSYSVNPELPRGLSINGATGTISGTPYLPTETRAYVITASNPGGIMTMTLMLGVGSCKGSGWTNDVYLVTMVSGSGSLSIKEGTTTTTCSMGTYDASGNAVLNNCYYGYFSTGTTLTICMPPSSTAKFTLSCTDNTGCYTQVQRADGNRWPVRFTYEESHPQPYDDSWDFPSSLTPLTALGLSVSEVSVYTGFPMDTVEIIPNGCYKEITIEPSLGVDFTLSLENPRINTNVNGILRSVYTITARGDAGEASATLTVHFVKCGDDGKNSPIKFVMTTTAYGSEQSYVVIRESDQVEVHSSGRVFGNYVETTTTLCLKIGDYKVVLSDSYGDGWSTGSFLRLFDSSDSQIQEFTIPATSNRDAYSYTGYFSVAASTAEGVIWKALFSGEPPRNWNAREFDASSWSDTSTSYEYGTWSSNSIYFRYEFEVTDAIKYPLVQYGVWYKDGIIIYLNGEEVYRRNMPSGNIRPTTLASSKYEGYYMRVGSAPGYILVDGKNTIAIEIHKHASTTGTIQFAGYANALQGDCISRVDGGTITESSFFNQPTSSAAQAWDRNTGTEWIENGSPAWTIYSYNFDRMEWVNRLSLVSASISGRDPMEFHLYGSTDGVNWEDLFNMKAKQMFTSRRERREFMMLNHLSSFSQYKFEMMDSDSGFNKLSMAVIDIMSCQLNYCVKDGGFPGVMSDETAVADCPEGYFGEMFRKCSLAALRPQWEEADMSQCRSTEPPKKQVYIDVIYYLTQVTKEQMESGMAETIRVAIADASNIVSKNVDLWYMKDISSEYEDTTAVALYVRVTLSESEASSGLKSVSNSLNAINERIKTNIPDIPEGFSFGFYREPILQQRKGLGGVSIALIVILVILVVIIVAIAAFYIWVRTKSKKSKNGAKQLRAGKVHAEHLSGSKNVRV